MKTLNCDICKNIIKEPVHLRNYFHKAHRDICESCYDKIEYQIKPTVRGKQPFSFDWYTKLFQESIEKACQKGKVDVKVVL